MTDQDPMPFGKYKDWKMEDVPAKYLLWLYEEQKLTPQVKAYIEENLEWLKLEDKQINNRTDRLKLF